MKRGLLSLLFLPFASASFLGCFDLALNATVVKKGRTIEECRDRCERYPLYTVTPAGCACSAVLPDPASSQAGSCVDVWTTRAAGTSCRLSSVPFTPGNFEAAYDPEMARYDDGKLTLVMDGTRGTRVASGENALYVTYQVAARVSPDVGVVSAFYLRSDYAQETSEFSEVDVEFINGPPGVPSSVWLNSYDDGESHGTRLFTPKQYAPWTAGALSTEAWVTYTIDWRKDGVTWYMNGHRMDRSRRSPSKPSHVTFSIWTSNGTAFDFGGFLPSDAGEATSQFRELRQLQCAPAPVPAPAPEPVPVPVTEPAPAPAPEPAPVPVPSASAVTSADLLFVVFCCILVLL
jgi:hypothetical protein